MKLVDVSRLRGQRLIAANNAFKLGAWIDVVCCMDLKWPEWNKEELSKFGGLKISSHLSHATSDLAQLLNIRVVQSSKTHVGISEKPPLVASNGNSGAFAINLAVQFGAKKIVLLGFDMKTIEQKHNWHDDHIVETNQDRNPYPKFLARFPAIAADLTKLGIECVNATPGSALTVFPIVEPESVMP